MKRKMVLGLLVLLLCAFSEPELGSGFCKDDNFIRMKVADSRGWAPNNADIDSLARFAVQEYNNKLKNSAVEFSRVLKATEQIVAGKLYHLTLEAIDAGEKRIYEAKVWVKPWVNFKQLQEFRRADAGDGSNTFSLSDLGFKRDTQGQGWRAVPTSDPEVQDAANHAVKSIQQRSNSLSPYELLDIMMAKAKVIEDAVKFELLVQLRRGIKVEIFRVEMMKNFQRKVFLIKN